MATNSIFFIELIVVQVRFLSSNILSLFISYNMKICIIDDEWICHLITQKLIEKMISDSQILHFANGQDAFDFFVQHHLTPSSLPDLIFLDINMPVANGWKFLDMLEELKVNDYDPRIYITSSSQDIDDITTAENYSVVQGYLPKPLTPSMLKEIFRDMGRYCLNPISKMEYQYQ